MIFLYFNVFEWKSDFIIGMGDNLPIDNLSIIGPSQHSEVGNVQKDFPQMKAGGEGKEVLLKFCYDHKANFCFFF